MICRIERPCRSKTLISTACSWVNISTAQKKPPSSPRGGKITSARVGQFYFGADKVLDARGLRELCVQPSQVRVRLDAVTLGRFDERVQIGARTCASLCVAERKRSINPILSLMAM